MFLLNIFLRADPSVSRKHQPEFTGTTSQVSDSTWTGEKRQVLVLEIVDVFDNLPKYMYLTCQQLSNKSFNHVFPLTTSIDFLSCCKSRVEVLFPSREHSSMIMIDPKYSHNSKIQTAPTKSHCEVTGMRSSTTFLLKQKVARKSQNQCD